MLRVLAPHRPQPALEAALDVAAEVASEPGYEGMPIEQRVLENAERMWRRGYTFTARRHLLAMRIAWVTSLGGLGMGVSLNLTADTGEISTQLVLGALMWLCGVAAGAQLLAWLRPAPEAS